MKFSPFSSGAVFQKPLIVLCLVLFYDYDSRPCRPMAHTIDFYVLSECSVTLAKCNILRVVYICKIISINMILHGFVNLFLYKFSRNPSKFDSADRHIRFCSFCFVVENVSIGLDETDHLFL